MSTQYPILNNRPINQWKVVELKEELRRRKLTTNGLKDDLIRRLDEAIRNERGVFEAETSKGFHSVPEHVDEFEYVQSYPGYVEMGNGDGNNGMHKTGEVDEVVAGVDIDGAPAEMDQGKVQEEVIGVTDSVVVVGEPAVLEASVGTSNTMNAVLVTQIVSIEEAHENNRLEPQNKVVKSPHKDVVLVRGPKVLESSRESSSTVNEVVGTQIVSREKTLEYNNGKMDSEELTYPQMDAVLVGESVVLDTSMETISTVDDIVALPNALSEIALENNEAKLENEGSKTLQMDVECDASYPGNQVHEISPYLGVQVKSESISTDNVSNYENKELKENLITNNIHLELEVGKPEMVQPSSSEGPSNDGSLHPLDDQMPHWNQDFVKETDDNKSTLKDFNKKNDCADDSIMEDILANKPIELNHNSNIFGDNIEETEVPIAKDRGLDDVVGTVLSPDKMETSAEEKYGIAASAAERKLKDGNRSTDVDFSKSSDVAEGDQFGKINLDQSSADDSLEEVLESKYVEYDRNSDKMDEKIELTKAAGVKVSDSVDAVLPDFSFNKLDSSLEKKVEVGASSEKRKSQVLADETAVGNEGPRKRQRRWNSESLIISKQQGSSVSVSTTVKDLFQTTVMKRNLTRSNSALCGDAPMERVVPPSPKLPTNSLRIDRFLRPFTLKAVQELLAKTGNVCSFWMDHIKTHCYVMYSSIEEAIETRNAVYNLQWPPNGGHLLVAEFVDPQEVKLLVEAPRQSAAAQVTTSPTVPPTQAPIQPPPFARPHSPRQHLQPLLPQLPPTANTPTTREWLHQPPPPPLPLLPPTANHPTTRERLHLPPPPPLPQLPRTAKSPTTRERLPSPPPPSLPEKVDLPIFTLDDLFRKTRATPRIYYLPLTEEQVFAKLATQGKGYN